MRQANLLTLVLLIGSLATGQAQNVLTVEEKGQGFKLLFDGTMQSVRDNFVAYQKDGATVTTLPANIEAAAGGEYFFDNGATQDIRSKAMYDNFEMRLDYRVSDNAGIFYRAALLTGSIYENSIEYPLYNGTPVPGNWNAPGAAYDIYAPTENNYKSFGTGEWNTVRIRLHQDSVYHWHNGVQVVKFSFLSSDYLARKVARKWANVPCVAVEAATVSQCDHGNPYRKTGYIGFQTGYPGQLYIRNIKIAKYPFTTVPSRAESNPAPARPSMFSAVPNQGAGFTFRASTGKPFRLDVHHADGSRFGAFEGAGDGQAMDIRVPGPGLYFLRLESGGQVEVRTAIRP